MIHEAFCYSLLVLGSVSDTNAYVPRNLIRLPRPAATDISASHRGSRPSFCSKNGHNLGGFAGTSCRRYRHHRLQSLVVEMTPKKASEEDHAAPIKDDTTQTEVSTTTITTAATTNEKEWNPNLRKLAMAIATTGMIETGYLSYLKLFVSNGIQSICGIDGGRAGCDSVLDGPYATLHLFDRDVPLTVLGCAAYATVACLCALPLLLGNGRFNRMAIYCLSTAMATFSLYLLALLFAILHASCPFCVLSAFLSISLGLISWFGNVIPDQDQNKMTTLGVASFATTTIATLTLFLNVDTTSSNNIAASSNDQQQQRQYLPPPISSMSTPRTMALAASLGELNSKMYGTYWCSHCHDQKETMGQEAMSRIPYIECDRDGRNNQRALCKEQKIPGYPTWEIGGKLFPGEWDVDELEHIVEGVSSSKR